MSVHDKKNILFVCVENSRRSQMAEAIFNELAKKKNLKFRAISAGTMPIAKVDPNIIQVLNEIGINIMNVKPKALSMEMISMADKVITMGCLSRDVCPAVFIDKTIDWNIEEPKEKPIESVREIRDDIERRVKEIVESLER